MMNTYPVSDSSDEEIISQANQDSSGQSDKKENHNKLPKKLKLTINPDLSIEKPYDLSDETDDEKHNDPELSSFNLLIATISVADNYLTLLDSKPYSVHKSGILKGLRLLPKTKDAIDIAAVIFSGVHASTVARAINTFFKNNIDFQKNFEYEKVTVRNAYLALIDAGADAESIASAIIKHNNNKESNNPLIDPNIAYFIIINIVKLKNAGIAITDIICNSFTQLAKSVYSTHTGLEMQFDDNFKLILFLSQAKVLTDRVQLMLCSHDQYKNAGDIIELLRILKEKITLKEGKLEEGILDAVIKHGNSALTTSKTVERLREEDGINLTFDVIMTLLTFQLEKEDFLDGLVLLKSHNMLPNSMLITTQPNLTNENAAHASPVNSILQVDQPNLNDENVIDVITIDSNLPAQSEMKPSAVLTESFVLMLIKHPKVIPICNLLISCRGEGELYAYIEKYISLGNLEEMDSILNLNTFKVSITPKRIEEMSLRILEGAATSDLIDLIEQYLQEDDLEKQELKKPQEEDLIEHHQSPLPLILPVRLNCHPALFYHPSSPVGEQPTATVELHAAVNNSPKAALQEIPVTPRY